MGRLEDKVALVTGGGSGIGRAAARRFADEGATVFVVGRRTAPAGDDAPGAGRAPITAMTADVTDARQLEDVVQRIGDEVGRLDVVYANAGLRLETPLGATPVERLDAMLGTNVVGVFLTVQAAVPLLAEGASVILGGSVAGATATAGFAGYGATKAAVRSLARTWALELGPRAVRVNSISPGPTDTPMMRESLGREGYEAARAWTAEHTPAGRIATPEDIAAAALFLASDESRFVNGTELIVDGGLTQI